MNETTLAPLADILLTAYADCAVSAQRFTDDHGSPPTTMMKVHYVLSVVQAEINASDRYSLGDDYADFGRVQIEDHKDDGRTYLLRSHRAIKIEKLFPPPSLFGEQTYIDSPIVLLVHHFRADRLGLLVAGTQQVAGKLKFSPRNEPSHVGTWLYSESDAFSNGPDDPFGDIGDLGDLGEGGGDNE